MRAASFLSLAFVIVATLSAVACRDKPAATACEKLFEKTVELYAVPNGIKVLGAEQKAEYQQSVRAMRKQLGPSFVDRCRQQYSPAQVACQLQARTLSALAKCWL